MALVVKPLAVIICNGFKSYKSGYVTTEGNANSISVLRGFSMNVEVGNVYSLVGSSGCGKTTVLSCLAGLVKLDQGSISVLGRHNSVSSRLRSKIGYMPQENSLYDNISIFETLQFFGEICGLSSDVEGTNLKGRIEYLRKLLKLPDGRQLVGTLSGGQRKRLSFAVAVLHEPQLLLLDEPTVGIDPLIRECIWKHLTDLSKAHGTTTILTTHYVDEAKHSNVVGIMREGQLMAEANPRSLMEYYKELSLERVVFRLSLQWQTKSFPALPVKYNPLRATGLSSGSGTTSSTTETKQLQYVSTKPKITRNSAAIRVKALMIKNCRCLLRNKWMLAFMTLVPAMCMFITCITFRREPSNIRFGVVNKDLEDGDKCPSTFEQGICDTSQFSCKFISSLPTYAMTLQDFTSTDCAIAAVQKGDIWGYIFFPSNYSDFLTQRHIMGAAGFNEDEHEAEKVWNGSQITVSMDQTNTLILGTVKTILYNAFERFHKTVADECGLLEKIGEFPLQYHEPVVGSVGISTLDYIAPGVAVALIFFFPLTVAVRFISERRQGTMSRCIVAGTQIWEILLAYAIPEIFILLLQNILVQFILQYCFSIGSVSPDFIKSYVLTMTICVLEGLAGLSSGFLLAILCTEESQAAIIIIATMFPSSFISGIMWPLEGMPRVLQKISPIFPMALPGEALRFLMVRGWGIDSPNVWKGFLSTFVYILIPFTITVVFAKKQMQG